MATISTARPDALAGITEEQIVDLDVRPILRKGGEPFSLIMDTVDQVPSGSVFRLRATFKPLPLFGVLKMKGWDHWIEFGIGDDWRIWFYRRQDFV